jgi:hypothetical protein
LEDGCDEEEDDGEYRSCMAELISRVLVRKRA